MNESGQSTLNLPNLVVGMSDLGRLLRELSAVDEYVRQSIVRQGVDSAEMPKLSHALIEISSQNNVDLAIEEQRINLLVKLKALYTQPPSIHISFSAEPSPAFIQKVIAWLRDNIHPVVLLQVGLQPSIAAGCTVRTTNKYFDLSLRKDLARHGDELLRLIKQDTEDVVSEPVTSASEGYI